jgi:Putative MetA-pathway of phenol degradation
MYPNLNRYLALSSLVACAAAPLAAAADDEIATDRPDFVESSDVVGKGRIQIETSLAYERDSRDGSRTRTRATPTLLRLGISDTVELRLETEGALRQRVREAGLTTKVSGQADLSLGAKWHVQDGDEAARQPGMAWLLHADGDTGSGAFRGQGWRPSLRLVAEWEFAGGYSLGVMPGLFVERNEAGQRYTGGLLGVVVGKSITELTRGFVEVAAQQLASGRNGGPVTALNMGLAHLLTPTVQVDTAVSWGLTKHTPDFGWTAGLSVRF